MRPPMTTAAKNVMPSKKKSWPTFQQGKGYWSGEPNYNTSHNSLKSLFPHPTGGVPLA